MESIQGDTLIVGGGSAGCALAARLSADPGRQVILIEAGPDDQKVLPRLLSGKFSMTGDRRFDWLYYTEADPNMADRPRYWPRGKVLGGSSTVNGMIAVRGHRDDYDDWAAAGCAGWAWKDVLPYFRRLENCAIGSSELHNVGGPMSISSPRGRHFLCDRFAAAARQTLNVSDNDDFNGEVQDGAAYYHLTHTPSLIPKRVSASSAYLREARRRSNLRIITDAHVHRITFQGRRATGVVYERGGVLTAATARRQVILAAGAIGSPQLLQLSGIGDPDHLRPLGIDTVIPLRAVGENLQDHLRIGSDHRFHVSTLREKVQNACRRCLLVFEGMVLQTGLKYGAMNFGIFARTDPSLPRPDVQFHIHPSVGSLRTRDRFSVLSISGWQLRPQSRGRIAVRSADPQAAPAIFANYLSCEADQRCAVATLRIAQQLTESAPLRPYQIERLHPVPGIHSDSELLDYARQTGETTYHPVGTCRMGADAASVVDPHTRVRGVAGLYVADASIMPTLISGNTNVPAVMIGERASDLIMEDERNLAKTEI
jgi:choline dehydrogenase